MMKKNIVKVVNMLYLDKEKESLRQTGFDSKLGNIKDFNTFMKRLRKTYDVDSLTAEEIYGLLPPIFDGFKQDA